MGETNNTQLSKAVIYARVSSKEQEKEGFSIPAQLKLLRNYAEVHRLSVAREFVDAETAKQAGRTSFSEMLAYLKKNSANCRTILVEKTDRLYRNLKDWVTLDELDLEIHFVKENVVLSRDSRSSEKFMHGIKVLMAKNYIDNLSEETKKGLIEKAEQGIWPSYAPLGYRNVTGSDGKKIIEVDLELAPIVTKLFEWYATGNYSLRDVTKKARSAGLVFRKSKDPVPTSIIHRILRSRFYTGDFDFLGKTYRGKHAPLISCELWERVQAILDRRFDKRHRKAKHDFAFSSLIACGHCGCSLVGEVKKGRYVYYHCTGYKGKCPEPYTREEILEDRFTDLLKRLVFDEQVLAWVTEALRHSHEEQRCFHEEAIARLQAEYNRLQNRIDTMYVDKLDGLIDAAFFERKVSEWRTEQDKLLRSMGEHQSANQSYLYEGIRLLELSHRAPELFQRQEPREKRKLLNFVLSNCTWKDGGLSAEFRQPFDLLVLANATHKEQMAAGGASSGHFGNWLLR